MAFKQRQDAGNSALNKVSSGYTPDPKEFVYNKLDVNEGVVLRILSLHEEDVVAQPVRKACVKSAKHKDSDGILVRVPDPGPEFSDTIYDDAGDCFSDLEEATILWVPVWVLYTVDKNGVVKEEIDELMYVKLLPGLQKSLKKLQENVKDGFEFDVIPPYDLRLEVIKDDKIPNYVLVPVTKIITSGGKGKGVVKEDCPRYLVDDLAVALGPDAMKVLDAEYDDLLEHMAELVEKEADPASIKKRFLGKGNGNSSPAEPKGGGMRRGVSSRASEAAEDEPDEEPEEESGAEEEKQPARYAGGVGKRFNRK